MRQRPEWRGLPPGGALLCACNGHQIPIPSWRGRRGKSKLEGFRPRQAGALSPPHLGDKPGQAHHTEAAIRRNRRSPGLGAEYFYRDVRRPDAMRAIPTTQGSLGIAPQGSEFFGPLIDLSPQEDFGES